MEKWLHGQLGKGCLAPCTGQDYAALKAFIHLVDAYGRADLPGREHLLAAMRATVLAMQEKVRELAKKSIPHVLDWGDESKIWAQIEPETEKPYLVVNNTDVTAEERTFLVSGYATINVFKETRARTAAEAAEKFTQLSTPHLCHQCSSAGQDDEESVELNGFDDTITATEVEAR